MHRLRTDWTACRGHGSCVELLPELLDVDPWGYPLAPGGDPDVPNHLLEHAARAVASCPVLALHLQARPERDGAQPADRSGTRA